ncbi:MAG: SprB repeat-containing protein, partial [Bacteroidota bacterium]
MTDKNGCTATATVTITEDILPLAVNLKTTQEINCNGDSNAALAAEVSGGKSPFTYAWSTENGRDAQADQLTAGNYEITVTDATGTQASVKVSIKAPAAIEVSTKIKASANTNESDGQATVAATGGAGKFKIKWDSGESKSTAEKLAAGTHQGTVTDKNGCSATGSVVMTEDILPLKVTLETRSEIACAGESTATLEASISGGKSPFQYQWNTDKGQATQASNLPAGTYSITITDAAGSTVTAKANVKAPNALSGSIQVNQPANTNQSDGQATIQVKGGTAPYTYQWDTGEKTAKAEKLAEGNHAATVTDQNGCTAVANITITEDIQPLTVSLQATQTLKCAGETNAAISAKVNGGKPPYQFAWNTDKGSEKQANALAAGTYQLTVSDALGKEQSAQIEVKAPANLTVAIDKNKPATNEDSRDGRVTLKVNGGTAPYQFNWDN